LRPEPIHLGFVKRRADDVWLRSIETEASFHAPYPHASRARRADGSFEPANPTGPPIDTEQSKGDTFVAPTESYLIFSSNDREGYGSSDLFVAFRTPDGGWSEPRNMGPVINTEELEFCPMVSPDGRWLSFSRRYGESWPTTTDAEIYWMDASIIEDLRDD
jgi:hypothetical protein